MIVQLYVREQKAQDHINTSILSVDVAANTSLFQYIVGIGSVEFVPWFEILKPGSEWIG